MSKEKWKRLKEEKGYLISSWGRIFSLKTERFMRPYQHKSRANLYWRIDLVGTKHFVHVLVAKHFKQKEYRELLKKFPSAVLQVGHDDRNTLNPNANNLSWETEVQNKQHRWDTDEIIFGGFHYRGYAE